MTSFGSWSTPITSALVVRAAADIRDVTIHGDTVTWSERRPEEGGRTQLVRRTGDGPATDLLPDGCNARTAVHEYGGKSWWTDGGDVWFTDWADQRLYRLTTTEDGAAVPVAVTPEPSTPRADRWVDGEVPRDRWMLVVREHHPDDGAVAGVRNEIVVLDTEAEHAPRPLVSGPDFVSDPARSPSGEYVSWLQWWHPDMPWDGTQLCIAELHQSPTGPVLGEIRTIAGHPHHEPRGEGEGESVFQPRWSPDGDLWFVSDRSGWWNLYRWRPGPGHADAGGGAGDDVDAMVVVPGEIGFPQWGFGMSRYCFAGDDRVVYACSQDGRDSLSVLGPAGSTAELDLPYTSIGSVRGDGDTVVFVGATATTEPGVVRVMLAAADGDTPLGLDGPPETVRSPRDLGVDPGFFAAPEPITFATAGDRTAHALYYSPTNPDETPPTDELPPLLVVIHGGPTAAAGSHLQLDIQFWTSRGFAVVDVNYGGSTGYGREYRRRLEGQWGVVDVDDCTAAARHLADTGRVDPERLLIRGGSAGGYTTLAALALRDTFAAGANHYGVADLAALAAETHKFESRYLEGLVAPYPEGHELYEERSPINHLDGFDRPLIVLQGLEDEVVPPNQSQMIVDALRDKGVPVAYVPFEGEQHGFRQAGNIRRALECELSFYAQVLGFDLPADEDIERVKVENM